MDQPVAVAVAAGFIGGAVSLLFGFERTNDTNTPHKDAAWHVMCCGASWGVRCFMTVFDMATDSLLYYYGTLLRWRVF